MWASAFDVNGWKMAKKLAVKKMHDGGPGVTCPRCEDVVAPLYLEMLRGYNCPECEQTFDPGSLSNYKKALKAQRENDERAEYGSYE